MLNESTFLRAKMVWWSVYADVIWTEKDAQQYQDEKGYPTAGYGFYGFTYIKIKTGWFNMTWQCSGSCE